jgi:hypothetical protein
MERRMTRVVLVVGLLAQILIARVATAGPILPKFSLDPASPSINGSVTPDDVMIAGPTVHTHGTALGLQDSFFSGVFDALDALSYGVDPLIAPLYFSVSRVAVGASGSAVRTEAAPGVEEAHGDVFRALPPFGSNVQVIDEETLGLVPGFFGDAINALEIDSRPRPFTYFSVDALSASNNFGNGTLANDILISTGNGNFGLFAEGESHMGLLPLDDLDALVLHDRGRRGRLEPGVDVAWFSLSTFSPSAFTFTGNPYIAGVQQHLSPSDILFTDFTGTFSLAFAAGSIGMLPDDDTVAIDTVPEPSALTLLLIAGIGAAGARRLRWQRGNANAPIRQQ